MSIPMLKHIYGLLFSVFLELYLNSMFTQSRHYSIYIEARIFNCCLFSLKRYLPYLFLVVEKNPKLPRYIFLIWQDNIVRIICMFKEIKEKKKQLKYVALGGVTGHQMAAALFPVHRGGCTYLLWLFFFFCCFFFFLLNLPHPLPLPLSYAVMQADVGLFCCVLLSLTPSPDYIPT